MRHTHQALTAGVVAAALAGALAVSGCSVLDTGTRPNSSPASPPVSSGSRLGVTAPGEGAANQLQASGHGTTFSGAQGIVVGAPAAKSSAGQDAAQVPAADRLIIRDKTMRMEVAKVTTAVAKIRALASRDGADITQMQVATSSDQPVYAPATQGQSGTDQSAGPLQAFVTIRVPAAKYQSFIDAVARLGTVLVQSENTEDVTQQHIDLKARLGNLQVEERRLRQFFSKARNVTEMLRIEAQLSRVRGEIESLAAQVAYLERQAAMASVTVELTEPAPLVRPTGIDWGVGSAFTQSVRSFVDTMNVLIVLLGPVIALLVFVGLPVALVVWLLTRRSRRRRHLAQEAGADTAETA
jgi:Domain of unknown function (DUF4349)